VYGPLEPRNKGKLVGHTGTMRPIRSSYNRSFNRATFRDRSVRFAS
jgi:hypothetical protein